MIENGHTPIMDKDYNTLLNTFVYDVEYHNGPGCSKCGWSDCWHCLDIKDIPKCKGLCCCNDTTSLQ